MNDRQHGELSAKLRALIDDALAELVLLGFPSIDEDAKLMVVQYLIRIEDREALRQMAEFASSLVNPEGD